MTNSEALRGILRVSSFVGRIAGRADSESGHVAAELLDGPTDQTRVDTAAQQRADGYVREETFLDCADEESFGFFERFRERWLCGRRGRWLPVGAFLQFAVGPLDNARGANLVHVAINRALIGDVAPLQIFGDREIVDLTREATRAQRACRRGESELSVLRGVEQRFDAESIAHE